MGADPKAAEAPTPCPFCGSLMTQRFGPFGEGQNMWWTHEGIGVECLLSGMDIDGASVRLWNTRAPPTPNAGGEGGGALLEAVAKAIARASVLGSDSGVDPKWSDFRDEARAAIEIVLAAQPAPSQAASTAGEATLRCLVCRGEPDSVTSQCECGACQFEWFAALAGEKRTPSAEGQPGGVDLGALIDKLPAFDPGWTSEQQDQFYGWLSQLAALSTSKQDAPEGARWSWDMSRLPNEPVEVAFDGGLGMCNVRICTAGLTGPAYADGGVPIRQERGFFEEARPSINIANGAWRPYAWRPIDIPPLVAPQAEGVA